MVERKRRVRVLMSRNLMDAEHGGEPPDETLSRIPGWPCPHCKHVTLFLPAGMLECFCGMCDGKTPYRADMPLASNPHLDHPPIVYYMRMGDLIKIGTTTDLYTRAAAINPQGIAVVEFGSYELEYQRHQEFVDLHSHGEWFYLREPLWRHIVRLREEFAQVHRVPIDEWIAWWRRPAQERDRRVRPLASRPS